MQFHKFKLKICASLLLFAVLLLAVSQIFGIRPTSSEIFPTAKERREDFCAFAGSRMDGSISVSAKSAVILELSTGASVFEKNAHQRLPMASTTKIMTALVVLENAKLDETVIIPKEACGIEGSSVYLREGECFTVKELLYALLLASANDAATALAIHTFKSTEAFAGEMNALAKEMGLTDTHFKNPHGLHDEEHYTTAYELALIARRACENETFCEITSTEKTVINQKSRESARSLVNHNRLLRSYEGCFGVKTGFTKSSGRCLVSAAERDGLSFIAVTLNAPNDWNDHKVMLDRAFSSYEKAYSIGIGEISYSLPLVGSLQKSLICTNASAISVIADKGKIPQIDYKINARRFEFAPISAGARMGCITFFVNGRLAAECDLVAKYSAAKRKK